MTGGLYDPENIALETSLGYYLSKAKQALVERIVPPVLRGEKISALAVTGPSGCSDVARLRTTAVRQGDWKYHSREIFKVKSTTREHNGPTLYNLKDDIGESNNLIDQYPEIAERLAKVLKTNPNKRAARNKK